MATIRADFISGQVQENPLSSVATTLTMSGRLQDLPTVTAPDVAYLTIDPEGVDLLAGSGTEVVKVTAYVHAAGTATIARGQRGKTQRPHSQGVKITLSWMKEDIDEYVASAVLFDSTNPTAVDVAGSAAAGSGTVAAHRNHVHNVTGHDKAAHDALHIDADTLDGHDSTYFAAGSSVPAADPGVPQAVAPNAAGSAGTSGEWSHGDHVHGLAVDVPSASHPGDAQALGSGPKAAFSDHVHAREADGTYNAATLQTHNAAYFATATDLTSEATARGTADNKRLKLIGATGSIGGTDPAVDGSVELLAQFGKGDVTSDGTGAFTFGFPVTFPNACIGVFLQNSSGSTAQRALIPTPSSATTTACTGHLTAPDTVTAALSSTITLQWVAYGW